jgi:hypothetical protein
MGVTVAAYCQRCRVSAPEVGDFGVIYDGLGALRLVAPELAGFEAFLDEHGKHRVVQVSDNDDDARHGFSARLERPATVRSRQRPADGSPRDPLSRYKT